MANENTLSIERVCELVQVETGREWLEITTPK